MLSDIQSCLRAGIAHRAQRVGPFLLHFDNHTDNPFRNYAVPDDDARPSEWEIAQLVGEFRDRGRMPRLEFVAPPPATEQALAAAGFVVDRRLPLMTVDRDALVDSGTPGVVRVGPAASQAQLWAAAHVQHIGYAEDGEVTRHDVDRLTGTVEAGGGVVVAWIDDVVAGAGLFASPSHGLAEIAAVAVLPEFRRRGVASAVVTELSRAVFGVGAAPYLQTESENEERLYGRLGYRTVGSLVVLSLPASV